MPAPVFHHVSGSDDPDPTERAKEIQARLVVLRLRKRTANFENREAIRREINRLEEELRSLGGDPEESSDGE